MILRGSLVLPLVTASLVLSCGGGDASNGGTGQGAGGDGASGSAGATAPGGSGPGGSTSTGKGGASGSMAAGGSTGKAGAAGASGSPSTGGAAGKGGSAQGTGGSSPGTGGSSPGTGGSTQGTGGSTQGTGGSTQGTGGSQSAGGSTSAGGSSAASCGALAACCAMLPTTLSAGCTSIVQTGFAQSCDSSLASYKTAGYCTGMGTPSCDALAMCCKTIAPAYQPGCQAVVDGKLDSTCASTLTSYNSASLCSGGTGTGGSSGGQGCTNLEACCQQITEPNTKAGCEGSVTAYKNSPGGDAACMTLYGVYKQQGQCN